MAYSASGMLIHAANAFAPKYITAVPTAPIGKRSDSETPNILPTSPRSPRAELFAVIIESATGSPAVDSVRSRMYI